MLHWWVVRFAELAGQVVSVARSLSKTAPFRCVALTGARAWRTQKPFLEEGVDVGVGTPQRLLDHLAAETVKLEKCRTLVLDEADVLLGVLCCKGGCCLQDLTMNSP